jgi:chemotaxis protein methyltransferase CheR
MTHAASAPPAAFGELALSPKEFARVAALIFDQARIVLASGKEGLVKSRLGKLARKAGARSYTEYLDGVQSDTTGKSLSDLIDALTTNKTSFYREGEHFEFLRTRVLPALVAERRPIRIWSAGCSSGEEPYTLGMVVHEALGTPVPVDVRILATDLSARILERARAAEYPKSMVREIPWAPARSYFVPTGRDESAPCMIRDDVREMIRFARLNLMSEWPMQNPFQAIFCRNVMIYFDRDVQERLVQRFYEMLAPGGHLFVGHSESLTSLDHKFRYVQPAVYVK